MAKYNSLGQFLDRNQYAKWMVNQAIIAAWNAAEELTRETVDPHQLTELVAQLTAKNTELANQLEHERSLVGRLQCKLDNIHRITNPVSVAPYGYMVKGFAPGSKVVVSNLMMAVTDELLTSPNHAVTPLYSADQLLGRPTEPRVIKLFAMLDQIEKLRPTMCSPSRNEMWDQVAQGIENAKLVIRNAVNWCTKSDDTNSLYTYGTNQDGDIVIRCSRSSSNAHKDFHIMSSALELSQAVELRKVNFPECKLGGLLVRPNPDMLGDAEWTK